MRRIVSPLNDRHLQAIEVLDDALRVNLVKRPFVTDAAREHHVRETGRRDTLTRVVDDTHRQCLAVAIDVSRAPERTALVEPIVADVRAYEAPVFQHMLGAIR